MDTYQTQENNNQNIEDRFYLDAKEIANFCNALSGKDENGDSRTVVSYMSFSAEDADDSTAKNSIYNLTNATAEIAFNPQDPRFFMLDIIFKSYDDPELKMMWGRLQQYKRNWSLHPDKTWIFQIHLLEKASVTLQTIENDRLVIGTAFNPTYFYLTREVPNYLALDTVSVEGELYGGNMIRMLLPAELVSFEISNAMDTSEIKGEVQRELDANDYINNVTDDVYAE